MQRKLAIGIGTAVAVLAAGGGVAALTWPSGSEAEAAAPVATTGFLAPDPSPEPPRIKTELNALGLTAVGAKADLPEQNTKRFSLLGVSWDDGRSAPDGTIEVKTRSVSTGKWSAWQSLEERDSGPDGTEAADLGRGATEPLWVGPSDGVAARVAGKGSGLPAGLRLDLVDPGSEPGGRGAGEPSTSASPSPSPTDTENGEPPAEEELPVVEDPPVEGDGPVEDIQEVPSAEPALVEESPAPVRADPKAVINSAVEEVTTPPAASSVPTVAPTSTVPVKAQFPPYYSRRAWSADETIVSKGAIALASDVRVVFLHHTAHGEKANEYECADAPAIIRAIQSYDVKIDGFSDLGYNFLVDKCGRLYEGRTGGVENAVVPAATKGYNTGSVAIAVIGNYETAQSTAAIETIVAQVAAARLGKYGYNPTSSGDLNGKTFVRLSGHRDATATACPGKNLYARLPEIRSRSQAMVTGMELKSVTGGGYSGGDYYVRDSATLTWAVANASTEVEKFEVLLDGQVVRTLPGGDRSVTVAIPAGAHGVTIRAVHTSGSTARVGVTVYGDTTAPVYRGPLPLNLVGGTYSTTSIPVRLGLTGADNLKFAGYTVSRPRSANLGPVGSWTTTVRPGNTVWTVTARDMSGNTRAASMTRGVVLAPETGAKKTGSWTKRSSKKYLSGKALAATRKNAKLTYTFTGRSAALLFSRGAKTGKAYIYLDGKKVATIDTRAGSTKYRQALWVSSTKAKKHTVQIVVAGTSGRPAVVSDGLAYIK
ncbi:N-acetylmuramoyl-L-alanine amidase [Actinoplanes sp. NEAU-A12]|uniref:N-acetylmuramoyl-L-alanine amidase n=1 Tax=Actinoplanes sandaracinus TaxID=3045177 RepID=A0ABT6WJX0_9ACTN|nr:N-acetylmuramoyl-L-alanine amidase [Actinoplanes sandaracinus]MDI6100031.1 N-acetylmuramoyl-L-alanine amidase [Actinoplanes sandaracinus]